MPKFGSVRNIQNCENMDTCERRENVITQSGDWNYILYDRVKSFVYCSTIVMRHIAFAVHNKTVALPSTNHKLLTFPDKLK